MRTTGVPDDRHYSWEWAEMEGSLFAYPPNDKCFHPMTSANTINWSTCPDILFVLFFLFCFVAMLGGTQGSLSAVYSGISLAGTRAHNQCQRPREAIYTCLVPPIPSPKPFFDLVKYITFDWIKSTQMHFSGLYMILFNVRNEKGELNA